MRFKTVISFRVVLGVPALTVHYFCRNLSSANDDTKMGGLAQECYERTLAKHHPWLIRKGAVLALYSLPTCKQVRGATDFFSLLRGSLERIRMKCSLFCVVLTTIEQLQAKLKFCSYTLDLTMGILVKLYLSSDFHYAETYRKNSNPR